MGTRALKPRHESAWRFDPWLAEAEQMQEYAEASEPLPCGSQTPEFVKTWMESHGAVGTIVVVRHSQLGLFEYLLDEVRRTDLRLKRIYLADHGVFRSNGENVAPPRGRFSLLAPVGGALEAASDGRTWMNGKPAFRRPLSPHERSLIEIARRQHGERA